MNAAETCRAIVNSMILHLVSAAVLVVQGVLLRDCAASARTIAAIGRQLHSNSRIGDHDFE
jgi:hypothetical protein